MLNARKHALPPRRRRLASGMQSVRPRRNYGGGMMVHPSRMMDNMVLALVLTAIAIFGAAVLIGYLFAGI